MSEKSNDEERDEVSSEEENSKERIIFDKIQNFLNLHDIMDFFCKIHKGNLRLRMIFLVSTSNKTQDLIGDFRSNYTVIEKEDLYKITNRSEKITDPDSIFTGYLWFLPDKPYFSVLFTFNTKKQLDRYFFNSYLKKSRILSYLWITQNLTHSIINHLRTDYRFALKKWKGKYTPSRNRKSKIRPNIEREITYAGNDAYESLKEINDLYGINIERFTATLYELGYFSFYRKSASMVLREGNLNTFLSIANYIFNIAERYMEKVREFDKVSYNSLFAERIMKISNDLTIDFSNEINNEILEKIIRDLQKNDQITLDYLVRNNHDGDRIFNIKIFNKNQKSSFKILLTKQSSHIFQNYNANFIGAIPLLDIIDYCQPNNELSLQVP